MADSEVQNVGSELEVVKESQEITSDENSTDGSSRNVSVITSEARTSETASEDKVSTLQSDVLTLKECCTEAFRKMTDYLQGELAASVEDYVLLENLNKLTVTKYGEMTNTAKTLITAMEELDRKYKSLEPYLVQIDKVEESVASLEQAAYRLDAYSKRLEAKFKKLERR